MKMFLVKLIFNVRIGSTSDVFDEQTRIIKANDELDAFIKAKALGRAEEEVFVNDKNEEVRWKFIDVLRIFDLSENSDGEQIYSISLKEEPEQYISFVHRSSQQLQVKYAIG
jgi:hypothetical protein